MLYDLLKIPELLLINFVQQLQIDAEEPPMMGQLHSEITAPLSRSPWSKILLCAEKASKCR